MFATQWAAGWLVETAIVQPAPVALPFVQDILLFTLVCLVASVAEETLYRGYWFCNLAEGLRGPQFRAWWSLALAVLLPALVFAARHANHPHATTICTLNTMLAGGMFSPGYVLTGELALPIGLHIIWNFLLGSAFGLPISGIHAPALFVTVQQGPDVWTGGAYGPEGGLLGMHVFLVGSFLIVAWTRRCSA